jgi:hypothetical protein
MVVIALATAPAWGAASAICQAQVTGRVVAESSDVAIPGAAAELWSDSGPVARGESDAEGRFTLATGATGRALWLLVRRIGFAPVNVHDVRDGSTYRVVMRPLPVSLPEIVVTACPGPDDPISRRLWQTMRQRYRLIPDHLPVFAGLGFVRYETTSADSVGYAAHEGWSGTGGYIGLGSEWPFLQTKGYAVPRAPGAYIGGDEGAIEYMRLDGHAAEHFVDSVFGALHVFLTAHYEDGLVVIPYCPRSTRHPDIEGALSLVPGGGIANAWWRFVVRKGAEQAGGQVFFAPPSDSGTGFAIPVRSVFWRLPAHSDRYMQWVRVYDGWGIGEDWYRRTHSGP